MVENGIYASLCKTQGITDNSTFQNNVPPEPIDGGIGYSVKKSMMKSLVAAEKGGIIEEEDIEQGAEEVERKEFELAYKSRLWALNKPEWGYIVMGGRLMVHPYS